ncbi:hypothetical protein Pelo_9762 [Pelomyxa schiedti]|nr:hypothetical protein Pelo_9762 [Pelomyxa schiedti]
MCRFGELCLVVLLGLYGAAAETCTNLIMGTSVPSPPEYGVFVDAGTQSFFDSGSVWTWSSSIRTNAPYIAEPSSLPSFPSDVDTAVVLSAGTVLNATGYNVQDFILEADLNNTCVCYGIFLMPVSISCDPNSTLPCDNDVINSYPTVVVNLTTSQPLGSTSESVSLSSSSVSESSRSLSWSTSVSESTSTSTSLSTSLSTSVSNSESLSTSIATSVSKSESGSTSEGQSASMSVSTSASESQSSSTSASESQSLSTSTSTSTSVTASKSTSESESDSYSESESESTSESSATSSSSPSSDDGWELWQILLVAGVVLLVVVVAIVVIVICCCRKHKHDGYQEVKY